MSMITIECAATDGRHDRRRIAFDFYRRYHDIWYKKQSLTCNICGSKMVADDELVVKELGLDAYRAL